MKILIIGDGKVGTTLVEHLSREGHDITVLDKNPNVIDNIVNTYDVMGISGNGASYEILKSADVAKTDLVIAATNSDEINILASLISRKIGAKSTIARVRNYDYNEQVEEMKEDFGINMTINPELETAIDILNIVNFPEALRVDTFADGKIDLIELYIDENNPLIGKPLAKLRSEFSVKVLVCAVQRGNEVIIPTGDYVFKAKDKIHVTSTRTYLKEFLAKIGFSDSKIKDIMIIGGGRTSVYLTERLIENKCNVKIIEKDYDRCVELSDLLPKATIINGLESDQGLLEEEGMENMDAVICLTGHDEENIIVSMYAHQKKIKKVIARVDLSNFASILETIGTATVVSPKEITANRIISYVRSTENLHGSNIITLYKLVNNQVEAIEFIAKSSSKLLGIKIKDIKLQNNILIASIIRKDELIIPSGLDEILADDRVIIITKGVYLDDLDDILE